MLLTEETMNDYLRCCAREKRLDPKTTRAYRCDLQQFLSWLCGNGSGNANAFERADIKAYLAHLNDSLSPKSVKRKMASLRAYAHYRECEHAEPNPFYGLSISIKEPKQLPKTISLADLRLIFSYAGKTAAAASAKHNSSHRIFQNTRNLAMIELLIATGIRISELCALDLADVDLLERSVRIWGKGAKERMVQIESGDTICALKRYFAARASLLDKLDFAAMAAETPQADPLFITRFGARMTDQAARDAIENLAKRACAAKHITPHMFRHTFATLLLEDDVDIRYIQALLGHSSIKTTEIYTHVANSKQRDILRKNNPRNKINTGL